VARELQRTYRGRAERPEDERRPIVDPHAPERAVLIASVNCTPVEEDDRIGEMTELLRTAGADVVHSVVQRRDRPDPRLYLGRGRLEELAEWVKENKPDLVACEGDLAAGQQRHLEDRLKTRVVDRTGIILDIFALHARSAEGKLQVELAQMEYSYSRQEGLWQHLERLLVHEVAPPLRARSASRRPAVPRAGIDQSCAAGRHADEVGKIPPHRDRAQALVKEDDERPARIAASNGPPGATRTSAKARKLITSSSGTSARMRLR
jgi:GTP-binding protein HflX